jgi:hypothetical protein
VTHQASPDRLRRNSAIYPAYDASMRTNLAFLVSVALIASALGGCDDGDHPRPRAKSAHAARISETPTARPGAGWRSVADGANSAWRFAGRSGIMGGQPGPDSFDGIRAALAAEMLPPRDSIRIADLIGRIARAAPDPVTGAQAFVTTSPWNDHTWLLWVSVGGLDAAQTPAISIDFDPASVASFRPLGDAGALPDPADSGDRAQVLYEVWPRPDAPRSPGVVYAVLHVGAQPHAFSRTIGPANFIDSIDNAPDLARFATAVAGFAELLRGDPAVRDLSCAEMIALAESADQPDPDGVRAQAIDLMRRAEPLIDQPPGDPGPEGEGK